MTYVYVPIFVNQAGLKNAAKVEEGDLVDAQSDLIGGIVALKYDDGVPRYVFSIPEAQQILDGWEQKTAEEINADYPGLIQGV
jgi:hypothetical protein